MTPNAVDPGSLDHLHEIVLPPPTPWWPPAPGWSVIGAGTILLLVAVGWQRFLLWRRNRYRCEALSELKGLEAQMLDPARKAKALATLAALVKRTALTAFGRESVASLNGKAWLQFLDRTGKTQEFSQGAGRKLEEIAYIPNTATAISTDECRRLSTLVRRWLRDHDARVGQENETPLK